MGWGKPFSSKGWATQTAKVAAPVLGSVGGFLVGGVPGAVAGGALGGGIGGGVGGGGIKSIGTGAALGGLGGYLAGTSGLLGTAAGAPLAGGAQGATQGTGLAGLLSGGGANVGSILSGAGSSIGNMFGSTAGTPLATGAAGATQGSGIAGALTGGGLSALGGGSSLSGVGKLASYALPAASIFSGMQQSGAISDIEKQKLEAERQRLAQLEPYNQSGQAANTALAAKLASGELGGSFNALDLSKDPVYQSQLAEGQSALDRKAAASGSVFSGAALKDAAKYSTDLAAQKQNEAYQRWLGQQQNTYNQYSGQSSQGLNAAAGVGNVYSGMGDISAGATGAQSNNLNSTLADLLNGSYGKKATIINGQVVYV